MGSEAAGVRGRMRPALWAALLFVAVLAAGLLALARLDLPGMGAWTGIRPLETKLEQLEGFARKGRVDALVLGSSIVDFGFSAELFSSLMSAHLGREYRAYNFATGGAEPRTLPKLYRLARLVAIPRSVIVVAPPEPRLGEEIARASPDHALQSAPVGAAIDDERRLRISRMLWTTSLARSAPVVREVLVTGHAAALGQAMGMEAYALDAHGDRVSYLVTRKTDELALLKQHHQIAVRPFPEPGPDTPARLRAMVEFYFAATDATALAELAELVRRDGGEIHLVSHAGAASLWEGPAANPAFAQGRADFYKAFAAALGARFHDAAPRVAVPVHALSDVTHLNHHGAEIYTREAFSAMTGKPAADPEQLNAPEMELPEAAALPAGGPTADTLAALLRRPAGQAHPLLRFRAVDSLAVPRLPPGPLHAALRMPDGREIVVPALPIGVADFVAEVGLPASDRPQALLLRLLHGGRGLRNPVASYEWLTSYPREPVAAARAIGPLHRVALASLRVFMGREAYEVALQRARAETREPGDEFRAAAVALEVMALPPARQAGEPLYIALRQSERPAELAVRLRARAPPGKALELGLAPPRRSDLLHVALPHDLAPGEYEIEVADAQSGATARSAPLQVTAGGPPAARRAAADGGRYLRSVAAPRVEAQPWPRLAQGVALAWSGIAKPSGGDRITLHARDAPGPALAEMPTRALAEGQATLPLPGSLAPVVARGTYELRLQDGAGTLLARSAPITFEAAIAPPPAAPAPVALARIARLEAEARPRVANGAVRVSWKVAPAAAKDWIGLFPAGGDASSRLDMVFTGGAAQGELRFPLSSAIAPRLGAGEYEFRFYSDGGWTELAKSERFRFDTLPADAPRVISDTRPRISAGTVKVAWSGVRSPSLGDWIGLFPVNGALDSRLDFVATNARGEGEVRFPLSGISTKLGAGEYEFRFYGPGWTLVARSEPLTFAP